MAENGGLSPTVSLALLAGLLDEGLDDLRDELARQKSEPMHAGVLADLLAARIEPRIAAMEQRLAGLAADMGLLKVRMRAPRRKIP